MEMLCFAFLCFSILHFVVANKDRLALVAFVTSDLREFGCVGSR